MPLRYKLNFIIAINGILLAGVPFALKAQIYLGIDAGVVRNNLNVSRSESNHFTIYASNGITVGTFVSETLSSHSSILIELRFSQKNYEKASLINREINEKTTNNYFEVPLGFRVCLLRKANWSTFTDLGGYFSYWLNSRQRSQLPDLYSAVIEGGDQYSTSLVSIKSNYQFDPTRDNRVEAGINIGMGESFRIKNEQIEFRFNFMKSLSDQTKENNFLPASQKNQSFKLTIAYAIQVGHH